MSPLPERPASERLDAALAVRGLATSRTQASRLITAGRVRVDGRVALKPSTTVTADSVIRVEAADDYVSRAAHKLVAALDGFGLDPRGRLALDCGASTGGFTQVLLERGARRVVALDVGHDQLDPRVRAVPDVTVIEGENARYLDAASFARLTGSTEQPTLVVADLSFISLTLVLPALRVVATEDADFAVLIKPQFEVGRGAVRGGIVTDPADHLRAIDGVAAAAGLLGLGVAGVLSSPILGEAGNREFLAHLRPGPSADRREWERLVHQPQASASTGADSE